MIEITNTNEQTVAVGGNVVYNSVAVHSGCCEKYRPGSGQITLAKPGRYLVTFGANIAIPTGEAVVEAAVGLALDGEVLNGSIMRVSPSAVQTVFNVSTQHYVDVFCNCCATISVENVGTTPIIVDNPNLTAVRVA